jgi:hypothetical protein
MHALTFMVGAMKLGEQQPAACAMAAVRDDENHVPCSPGVPTKVTTPTSPATCPPPISTRDAHGWQRQQLPVVCIWHHLHL